VQLQLLCQATFCWKAHTILHVFVRSGLSRAFHTTALRHRRASLPSHIGPFAGLILLKHPGVATSMRLSCVRTLIGIYCLLSILRSNLLYCGWDRIVDDIYVSAEKNGMELYSYCSMHSTRHSLQATMDSSPAIVKTTIEGVNHICNYKRH